MIKMTEIVTEATLGFFLKSYTVTVGDRIRTLQLFSKTLTLELDEGEE